MFELKEQNELYHHGVKGQKWGVRRYQNEDGTLTEKGKKRYSRMSPDQLQKELYKQVKAERAAQTNWSNQWNVSNTIGQNSKAINDKYWADRNKHQESEEYKKVQKKLKSLDRKAYRGEIDMDEYDSKYESLLQTVYDPKLDSSVRFNNGRHYVKEYLKSYGKDLNIGYLQDLGYSKDTAEWLNSKVMKANRKMLNGM